MLFATVWGLLIVYLVVHREAKIVPMQPWERMIELPNNRDVSGLPTYQEALKENSK